jgi:hypothetical protein
VSPSLPSGIRHVDGSALAGRPGGLLELALDPERIASGLALEGLRRDRTGAWWRGMEVELGRDAAGTVTVSGYGSDALRRRAGVVTGDERSSWFVEPLDDPSELVSSWTTTDTVLAGTTHVAGGIVHRGAELRRLRSLEPHGSLSSGDGTSIAFEGEDGDEVVVASSDRLGWVQKGGLVDGLPVMVWAERDGRSWVVGDRAPRDARRAAARMENSTDCWPRPLRGWWCDSARVEVLFASERAWQSPVPPFLLHGTYGRALGHELHLTGVPQRPDTALPLDAPWGLTDLTTPVPVLDEPYSFVTPATGVAVLSAEPESCRVLRTTGLLSGRAVVLDGPWALMASRRSLVVRGDGSVPGAWTTETGRLIEPVADERGWTAQVLVDDLVDVCTEVVD